jgi:hypothetical protein
MVFDSGEGIDRPHLLDSAAWHVKEAGTRKYQGQRLRTRDRHAQSIDAEQKLDVAR